MDEQRILQVQAPIRLDAWDKLSWDDQVRAELAERNRDAARRAFAPGADPVRDYLFALDVADEFGEIAKRGYSEQNARILAPMEPRVRWAKLRRDALKAAAGRAA